MPRTRLAAFLVVLALPSGAQAATVSVKPNPETGGSRVSFVAGPGEVNDLSANLFGSDFVFQDVSKPAVTPEPPCTVDSSAYGDGGTARCPAAGIDLVDIRLGAENDSVFVGAMSRPNLPALIVGGPGNDAMTGASLGDRVFGEGGADRLTGREGSDVLVGGPGDDQVDAAKWDEGGVDRVWCGTGVDSVIADPGDVVALDCEFVNAEPGPAGEVNDEPAVPSLDDVEPGTPTILLDIEIDPLAEVLRDGLVVTAGCSATCTITPQLRVSPKLARRLGLPPVLARSKSVTTTSGRRMRLRFGKRARRILRKQESVPFIVRVDARDVDGNPFAVETKLRLRS